MRCPRRSALQSATTTQKGRFHVRGNQQKDSQLARTMNELIKQIPKQISPPRKSASKTGDAFRSRVINVHVKRNIGAKPVVRDTWQEAHSIIEKEAPMTLSITKSTNSTVRNVLWNTDHGVYYMCRKVGKRKQLNQPRSWSNRVKRTSEKRAPRSNIRSCFSFAALFVSLAAWEQSFDALYAASFLYTHGLPVSSRSATRDGKKKMFGFCALSVLLSHQLPASTCCIIVSRILVTVVSTRTVWIQKRENWNHVLDEVQKNWVVTSRQRSIWRFCSKVANDHTHPMRKCDEIKDEIKDNAKFRISLFIRRAALIWMTGNFW